MANPNNRYLLNAGLCLEKFYDPYFSIKQRQNLADYIRSKLNTNIIIPNGDANYFNNELYSLLTGSVNYFASRTTKSKMLIHFHECCKHPDFYKLWVEGLQNTYNLVSNVEETIELQAYLCLSHFFNTEFTTEQRQELASYIDTETTPRLLVRVATSNGYFYYLREILANHKLDELIEAQKNTNRSIIDQIIGRTEKKHDELRNLDIIINDMFDIFKECCSNSNFYNIYFHRFGNEFTHYRIFTRGSRMIEKLYDVKKIRILILKGNCESLNVSLENATQPHNKPMDIYKTEGHTFNLTNGTEAIYLNWNPDRLGGEQVLCVYSLY